MLRTESDTGALLSFWVFIPPKFFLFRQVVPFQKTNGFQHAGAGLFLPIFLGFQSTFRLKGGRYHGASRLLALQTAATCSTFTSSANLLESTIYSKEIENSLQYIASFGDHGGIRTHGLSLRRSGQRSPTLSSQTPGNPSITTFLTARGCSHILRKTPNIPRKSGPKLAGR